MEYTIAYFKQKFEAIPEDQWCRGKIDDGEGRHCALGHCGVTYLNDEEGTGYNFTEESTALIGLFGGFGTVVQTNDTTYPYTKQSILAALDNIEKTSKPS